MESCSVINTHPAAATAAAAAAATAAVIRGIFIESKKILCLSSRLQQEFYLPY